MFKNNKIYKVTKEGKKKRVFFISGLRIKFTGKNAAVIIHEPCLKFRKCRFILGENATIEIQSSKYMTNKLTINSGGKNSKCIIGKNFLASPNCTFFNYGENNLKIEIKDECIFGENCELRTMDGHTVYSIEDNKILNQGKSIFIEKHCWIGANSLILKGVKIEENSVIAARSVVTKNLEFKNSLYAGIPCALKKQGINWDRKSPNDFISQYEPKTKELEL